MDLRRIIFKIHSIVEDIILLGIAMQPIAAKRLEHLRSTLGKIPENLMN